MAEDCRIESSCKRGTVKAGAVFNISAYAGGLASVKLQPGLGPLCGFAPAHFYENCWKY